MADEAMQAARDAIAVGVSETELEAVIMRRLMTAAFNSSTRVVAASFPRDRLGAKIAIALGNTYCKVRNVDFRAFVHPVDEILATAENSGFSTVFHDRDFVWNGVVFEKAS